MLTGPFFDASLPADLPVGLSETTAERPWYLVRHPPAYVREQFPAREGAEALGAVAGFFDSAVCRTTWYAVFWIERRRWCAVDLRGVPHVVRSDNGTRRRCFQRFDRVVLYVRERSGELTP